MFPIFLMHSAYYSHCATYYCYFLKSERSRIKEHETGTSQKDWAGINIISISVIISVLSSPKLQFH